MRYQIHLLSSCDKNKAFMLFCKTRRCSKSLWQEEEDGLMELTELWLMGRCRSRSDFVRRASPGGSDGRGQGYTRATPRTTPSAANSRRLLVVGRRQPEMKRDSAVSLIFHGFSIYKIYPRRIYTYKKMYKV